MTTDHLFTSFSNSKKNNISGFDDQKNYFNPKIFDTKKTTLKNEGLNIKTPINVENNSNNLLKKMSSPGISFNNSLQIE